MSELSLELLKLIGNSEIKGKKIESPTGSYYKSQSNVMSKEIEKINREQSEAVKFSMDYYVF